MADSWFYQQIRCGILRPAETVGGWRVLSLGKLLDTQQRVVNATLFIQYLQNAVEDYAKALETDDKLWKNFRKKMNAVCKNCEVSV